MVRTKGAQRVIRDGGSAYSVGKQDLYKHASKPHHWKMLIDVGFF